MVLLGSISQVEPFGVKTENHSEAAPVCACVRNFLEVVAMVPVMASGQPIGCCQMMELAGLLEAKSTSWRWCGVTGKCTVPTTGHVLKAVANSVIRIVLLWLPLSCRTLIQNGMSMLWSSPRRAFLLHWTGRCTTQSLLRRQRPSVVTALVPMRSSLTSHITSF